MRSRPDINGGREISQILLWRKQNAEQQKYTGATVLNANIGAYMDQAVSGLD